MTDFVGLTWDHPRGRAALEAAAPRVAGADTLRWEAQPLEGFESAPIDELAARYDLLVLDHPHLGDAVEAQCLVPFDDLFGTELDDWVRASVGPSAASYAMADHDGTVRQWALPLDAATQVSARDPRLVADPVQTWSEALDLAERGLVAVSLAGPHAYLSLCSIAVSIGASAAVGDPALERGVAVEALELLTQLAERAPDGTHELNPIGLLDRMRSVGDIGLVPLVYGYVNYSGPIAFGRPPTVDRSGPIGSTIGGTGIALTRRTAPTAALLDHLRWLQSTAAQTSFIPQHAGQPSAAAAWADARVDADAAGFYSTTRDTIESSWVRPRFAGYIPFQARASALVRDAVLGIAPPERALDAIDAAYVTARTERSAV